MKYSLSWLLFCVLLVINASCHKMIRDDAATGDISGRWQVVVDSSTEGIRADNHYTVYEGQGGDYYDFGSDSILTVKEGDSLFTYDYNITSQTSLTLFTPDDHFHTWPITYSIINPNTHNMNLLNAWTFTPGGILGRSVYLKRIER